MVMPIYTRASYDYQFVPGIGGNIAVKNYDVLGVPLPAVRLDIEMYVLKHVFKNKVTTHSGSNGATRRTRTGADWNFAAVLSFPIPIGDVNPFIEVLLGSMQGVAVEFNLGDPLFWTNRGIPVRSYQADNALLQSVDIRTDSSGDEVVGLNVTGEGNSLLWTCLDGVRKYPSVWF